MYTDTLRTAELMIYTPTSWSSNTAFLKLIELFSGLAVEVFAVGELVDWQEAFLGIKGEMARVVVGKVVGIRSIADDE